MNKEVLASHVADIEAGMKEYMPEENGYQRTVFEAVNYSLLAGGKRLRPMFLYEAYRMFGGTDEKAVRPFMMALEMIHTYSLVHDDLPAMDDDEYRRGKLTTHKKFGEAMGILSGDALLNGAFETAFLAFDSETEAAQIGRALKILGHKAGMYGMVGGQQLDLEGEHKRCTAEEIHEIHRLKTGALISAACQLGVIAAGGTQEQLDAADRYAEALGLAFQTRDDMLDVLGDSGKMGKATGMDENKNTFVRLYGVGACSRLIEKETQKSIEALGVFEDSEFLKELSMKLAIREC